MTISGIISISGKPGLYKVVAQGKNNIIVESLLDKKRSPAYASDRISALEDISIYTYGEDKALSEIFDAIYKKEKGGKCISHKEDQDKIVAYLLEVLSDYDQERVYASDIKKIFTWYNLLHDANELGKTDEEEKKEEAAKEKKEAPAKKSEPKAKVAPAAKAPASAKAKSSAKVSSAKKVATPKVGSNRGK
jgi:Domain of unknown function (DUF5606)